MALLLHFFGGGFGFYRSGYYRQGGPVGIGGIVGLILVVLVIVWLLQGHFGGFSRAEPRKASPPSLPLSAPAAGSR